MEVHVTTEEYPTSLYMTYLLGACHWIFKAKASTEQKIPFQMEEFCFTNTGETLPNASVRAGGMAESIKVANICSVI